MGDKYIIEIEKAYAPVQRRRGETELPRLYLVKGFNSLVFDETGLSRLEKYDPDKWYARGYEQGCTDTEKENMLPTDAEACEYERGRKMTNEEAVQILDGMKHEKIPRAAISIHRQNEALKMAITALRNQQEWIPCEERLPEKEGAYLVFKKGIGRDGEPFTEIVETYFEKLWGWITRYEVVAWMPLPPAYKGGKE